MHGGIAETVLEETVLGATGATGVAVGFSREEGTGVLSSGVTLARRESGQRW